MALSNTKNWDGTMALGRFGDTGIEVEWVGASERVGGIEDLSLGEFMGVVGTRVWSMVLWG